MTHPGPAVPPPQVLHGGLPQHGQKGGVDREVEAEDQDAVEALRGAAGTFEGEGGQDDRSDRTSSPQGHQGG